MSLLFLRIPPRVPSGSDIKRNMRRKTGITSHADGVAIFFSWCTCFFAGTTRVVFTLGFLFSEYFFQRTRPSRSIQHTFRQQSTWHPTDVTAYDKKDFWRRVRGKQNNYLFFIKKKDENWELCWVYIFYIAVRVKKGRRPK